MTSWRINEFYRCRRRMHHSKKQQQRQQSIFATVVLVFILLVVICTLAGCKSQVVPVKHSHSESKDSIEKVYVHDSIFIDRWHSVTQRGDTIILHDSIYIHDRRTVHDTITVKSVVSDTIPQLIEKPLTNNQIFLQRCGIAFWILLVIFIIVIAIGIWIKFAK